MDKAITDSAVLTPRPSEVATPGQWSRGDGSRGCLARIDDESKNVPKSVHQEASHFVDVRAFGAVGDGITDESAAFLAADAAAHGRHVLVSPGRYRLGRSVTLASRVRFEGHVIMPESAILSLTKDYGLATYVDAFAGDVELALKKALQALMHGEGQESLDMEGRCVSLSRPIELRARQSGRAPIGRRRVLRNGELRADSTGDWAPCVVASDAHYDPADDRRLSDVTNIASIEVGSLVEGAGVGREVYIREVDVAARQLTLSAPLWGAAGTQRYTFTRFRYLLDLSGLDRLDGFEIDGVELQCCERASGVMLPPVGTGNLIRNAVFNRPGHRGITSIGDGCEGLVVDHSVFISHEGGVLTQDRASIAINTNGSGVEIRNNRASQFRHFAVLGGMHNTVIGNHFFQGESAGAGLRSAGIVITTGACNTQVSGNYVDNCFIEWTNEHSTDPRHTGGFGFAGLSITNNAMSCSNVTARFGFIVIKPYGTGHHLDGMTVAGNTFRALGTTINRAERVDRSLAGLLLDKMRAVYFTANNYHNVNNSAANPLLGTRDRNSGSQTWQIDAEDRVPFNGFLPDLAGPLTRLRPRDTTWDTHHDMPFAIVCQGANKDRVQAI
jgi:hypothetical protein